MAQKGDRLTDHVTSEFINETLRRNKVHRVGTTSEDEFDSKIVITVKNHEAVAKAKYSVVALDTPAITYTGLFNHKHERIVFNTKDIAEADPHNWAVLQEPLTPEVNSEAEAMLVGVTWLKTPSDVTTDKFVKVNDTDPVFGQSGKAQALFSFSDGAGAYNTLIVMGPLAGSSPVEFFHFALTADLTRTLGATAAATISGVGAVEVTNTGPFRAYTGAEGFCVKFPDDTYHIIHVNQPAARVLVTLGSAPDADHGAADPRNANAVIAASPTPVCLTEYPNSWMPGTFPTSVANPDKWFGQPSDLAILEWNKNTDAYRVEKVIPAKAQLYHFQVTTANRPNGLQQNITANSKWPIGPGALPADGSTVNDMFNVAIKAKIGHYGVAIFDPRTSGYRVLSCEHTTTRIRCTVNGDQDGLIYNSDIYVTFVSGQDGININSGEWAAFPDGQVKNRFSWPSVIDGLQIMAEWDTVAGEWFAVQMGWECPPP